MARAAERSPAKINRVDSPRRRRKADVNPLGGLTLREMEASRDHGEKGHVHQRPETRFCQAPHRHGRAWLRHRRKQSHTTGETWPPDRFPLRAQQRIRQALQDPRSPTPIQPAAASGNDTLRGTARPASTLHASVAPYPRGLTIPPCGPLVAAVNPNTHQKSSFCARLLPAAVLASSIRLCPERPGAAI